MTTIVLRASALVLTATALISSSIALAADEKASDVAPTEQEARLYCEDAAGKQQILAEDMQSYMTECIAEYLSHPPGDLGSSPEPGGSGY